MWLDERGVIHTCAFADPSMVVKDELLADIHRLARADVQAVDDELERLEEEFFESFEIDYDRNAEDAFVEQWLPMGILAGRASSLVSLRELIAGVDQRWRLDAILVVQDLADESAEKMRGR